VKVKNAPGKNRRQKVNDGGFKLSKKGTGKKIGGLTSGLKNWKSADKMLALKALQEKGGIKTRKKNSQQP